MDIKIHKLRKLFIINTFLLFLGIKGKLNFLQLSRFGQYVESTYRYHFETTFNFLKFNICLLRLHKAKVLAIAFDPSYISKSGKHTPGVGYFWSGVSGSAKWGLEIIGFAALDKENHTAHHLEAIQTTGLKEGETLLDFYYRVIEQRREALLTLSRYLVADAYFSKKEFTQKIVESGFQLISRLRNDADLKYLYHGKQTKGRGRPKKYDGKICFSDLDKNKLQVVSSLKNEEIYAGEVYSNGLKRNILLVIVYTTNTVGKTTHRLFFSTDVSQKWDEVLEIYKLRFQIEFLYRDAKQHTGLHDSESRSENKMHFHFNTSLTSINLAKFTHWLPKPKDLRGSFSMSDVKTQYHNALLLNRFLVKFGIDANSTKNKVRIRELLEFGKIQT